jgi:hypothetical protein
MYLFWSSLDMYLLSEGTSGTIDARIMYAAEHEHLVIGFVAETAILANFVHLYCYNNKMQQPNQIIRIGFRTHS